MVLAVHRKTGRRIDRDQTVADECVRLEIMPGVLVAVGLHAQRNEIFIVRGKAHRFPVVVRRYREASDGVDVLREPLTDLLVAEGFGRRPVNLLVTVASPTESVRSTHQTQ